MRQLNTSCAWIRHTGSVCDHGRPRWVRTCLPPDSVVLEPMGDTYSKQPTQHKAHGSASMRLPARRHWLSYAVPLAATIAAQRRLDKSLAAAHSPLYRTHAESLISDELCIESQVMCTNHTQPRPCGGQLCVLLPDFRTGRAPAETWEMIYRQGTNRFCD